MSGRFLASKIVGISYCGNPGYVTACGQQWTNSERASADIYRQKAAVTSHLLRFAT
jgi:hypothetical protein